MIATLLRAARIAATLVPSLADCCLLTGFVGVIYGVHALWGLPWASLVGGALLLRAGVAGYRR